VLIIFGAAAAIVVFMFYVAVDTILRWLSLTMEVLMEHRRQQNNSRTSTAKNILYAYIFCTFVLFLFFLA